MKIRKSNSRSEQPSLQPLLQSAQGNEKHEDEVDMGNAELLIGFSHAAWDQYDAQRNSTAPSTKSEELPETETGKEVAIRSVNPSLQDQDGGEHVTSMANSLEVNGDVGMEKQGEGTREELEEEEPYIGPLEGRPPRAYNVATDVREGFYLFVRPCLNCDEPVWCGRATENPQFNPQADHYREVPVRWYIPCGRSKNVQQLFLGWDTKPGFKWRLDRTCGVDNWVLTDSILASWKPPKERRGELHCPTKASEICSG